MLKLVMLKAVLVLEKMLFVSDYDDVSWIPSTTCKVERFFSQCKLNHSDKRIALTNDNFEMIMFLKCHNLTMELVEKALKVDK